MKLLVTGGSGYLGACLLKRAPKQWSLAATYLAHPIEQQDIAAFRVDIRDERAVEQLVEQFHPDVVIHTAAQNSGEDMIGINSRGSRNVARAATRARAHLIHLSSDVIFDGEHAPYSESAQPHPITLYAESKALAEQWVKQENPRAVIVRTSLIYGFEPLDPRTRQILRGEMPQLFTDEYRCPIFVDDLADALLELAPSDFEGTLNVAGPQRFSRYEFGLKLAKAFHTPPRFSPALSISHPTTRPRDCTLDISLAQRILRTRLKSVDEVLANLD